MVFINSSARHRDNNDRRYHPSANYGGPRNNFNNAGGIGGSSNYNRNDGNAWDEGDNSRGGNKNYANLRERPARDWVPHEFSVEELYIEDNSQVNTYTEADLDQVEVKGAPDQRFNSWENSGLHPHLIYILINKRNFLTPRPIQAATIPLVLQGRDVITKAETGSGKTLAFVLPIVDSILKKLGEKREKNSPLALILEPTRELAEQIYREFQRVTSGTSINVVLNYGDIPKRIVLPRLANADIYVGTVGRFKDYLECGHIDLRQMRFFVLDEADQMLKKEQMDKLADVYENRAFSCTNDSRQTMLYSATMNHYAEQMANTLMRKDQTVWISTSGSRANKHIKQLYVQITATHEKTKYLENMFEKDKEEGITVKTLVFVATRKLADQLAMQLGLVADIRAESINGDRPQDKRSEVMNKFRSGEISVLVGTDVASRGHDIPHLDRVVLYDIPLTARDVEESLNNLAHRIGRTGRAREGTAIIFIDDSVTIGLAKGLVQMTKEVDQEPPEFLKSLAAGKGFGAAAYGETQISGFGGSSGFGEKKVKATSGFEESTGFGGFSDSGAIFGGFSTFGKTEFEGTKISRFEGSSSFEEKKEKATSGFGESSEFGGSSGCGGFSDSGATFGGFSKNDGKTEFDAISTFDEKKTEATSGFGESSSGFGALATSEEKKEEDQTTSSIVNTGFEKALTSEEKEEEKEVHSGFGNDFHQPETREEETHSISPSGSEKKKEEFENYIEKATKEENNSNESTTNVSPVDD